MTRNVMMALTKDFKETIQVRVRAQGKSTGEEPLCCNQLPAKVRGDTPGSQNQKRGVLLEDY